MGFLDALKSIAMPYDEDDDLFGEDTDFPEEAPAAPARRERREPIFAERERPAAAQASSVSAVKESPRRDSRDNRVVNIHTTTAVQVVLAKPERFEQAAEIADHLREKRTVVMNLETTNKDIARRLVDFLSGVAYANGGKIKKVAINTFIITPYNVDIMGDLIDELENSGVHF